VRELQFEPAKTGAQKILAAKMRRENMAFTENQRLEGWEVDIFLSQYYLVIEIDGFFHLSAKQQEKDLRKDQSLQAAGYHVLRFTNSQIHQDAQGCLREIKRFIDSHDLQVKKSAQVKQSSAEWREQLAAYRKKLQQEEETTQD
jgi:very-short-patch-repair endonuclease